jgi:phosphate transport system substrate-binding protein
VFEPDPSGATSYPIVTYSWVLLRKRYENQQTANALRDLFLWSLQDGQRYSSQIGYVPLPSLVAEKATKALEAVSSGVSMADQK